MGMKEEIIRVVNEKFVEMEKSVRLFMEMESCSGMLDCAITVSGVINIFGRKMRLETVINKNGLCEFFVDGIEWDLI